MLELVSNFDQEIKFVIGHAGTGKSTKLAQKYTKETLVLTPTHKAVAVLHRKGIEHAFTIHSVLKLVPTLNQNFDPSKNQKMQKLKRIGNVDLDSIKQVFIDEYSMIPQYVLDLLLEMLPAEASVTVFGDASQLPPVSGEPIDPLIYTDDIEYLTTQYRAEAPEVVETFERFVHYIEQPRNNADLSMHKDIEVMNLKDAMLKYEYDPEQDIILAYTNAKTLELNEVVKKYLGQTELTDIVVNSLDAVVTEPDNGYDFVYPTCIVKGRLAPENAEKTEIEIDKWNTKIPYKAMTVIIDKEKYNIFYDLNHYENSKKMKADVEKWQRKLYADNELPEGVPLAKWCAQNREVYGVSQRAKAWKDYLTHQNLVFDVRAPYARTVHKSQGSEYRTVFIAQSDIKKAIRNGYYIDYSRLMYVALSRAITRVVIIT